jgi:hypothetical protein
MKLFTSKLIAEVHSLLLGLLLIFSAVTVFGQYSVNVTYENPGVLNSSVGGSLVYTFNAPIPTGLNPSLTWTNVGTFINAGITAPNQYGGATNTQYLTAKPTTLTLNSAVSYFGMWWSAGSSGNTLTFKTAPMLWPRSPRPS